MATEGTFAAQLPVGPGPSGGRLGALLAANPVPAAALAGLLAGTAARWLFGQPELAGWIWLATLVAGGAPVVWKTLSGMLRGRFAADVVALLAIVTAVAMREAFAGVIIVLMQSGGEALERYSLRRASSSLDHLLARAPRRAQRRTGDRLSEVDVAEVRIGDTLVVRPGDLIPVDGALLAPEAQIDEAALTGEPLTRAKRQGEALLSGSVNLGDAFAMRADKLAKDSQYSRIVDLVRRAQEEKPPIQRLADRYAVWFTPLTLAVCAAGWWLTRDPRTVLAVLVVATPCPLILAVPVAVISGINRAARASIIVKGGAAIEQIGHARVMVFDKTGTLTFGTPVVDRVVPAAGFAADELLRVAGSVEQLSSHLLGRTLTAAAAAAAAAQAGAGGAALQLPSAFTEVAGRGVEAELDGRRVLVGSLRFLAERLGSAVELPRPEGALTTYVAIDGKPAGFVVFSDRLRPGVPELMRRLRGLGVRRTVMLTGDSAEHAAAIGREAGVDEIAAGLLPEAKRTAVQELQAKHGTAVMVGDGINDAPALATATVGVAMGAHGTGISAEAADVVLLVDDVTRVGDAVEIGQRMLRIARQSIYFGLGLSLALMAVAACGLIPPPIGALLQEAIDVSVILNALRARFESGSVR